MALGTGYADASANPSDATNCRARATSSAGSGPTWTASG